MPYPLGHTAILLRIFKSNAHMSCNLLEFEGFKPNFGILSSCTHVRVATFAIADFVSPRLFFQAARMYELQQEHEYRIVSKPFFQAARMYELQLFQSFIMAQGVRFQAARMYELQRQNLTKHVAHARITMCILTFSSVLQALTFNVLQSLSRFQGGKAP